MRWVGIVAVIAAACSKDAGTSGPAASKLAGGCDRRVKEMICAEYHGAVTADWVKGECPAYNAGFVPQCPVQGALARCVRSAGAGVELHELWYAPATRETATAMCQPPEGRLKDP